MSSIYKKKILDNGLRIIAHPMSTMQSVALGIWIRVGARYESPQYKGIAHFLEHLLFKGSKNYSCCKIKESIEGVGGSLNGFTSEELTCYLVKIPQAYLDLALAILSDMVLNPLLLPKEIDKERAVILEEIKMYKDLPQSYVYELLDELLWPKQPLGTPIIGTVDSVNRIKRESLLLFKQRYYAAPNIIISAAGLLDYDKFVKKISAIFSSPKEKYTTAFSRVNEQQSKPQLKLLHKETEQTHLVLGFHGFKRGHSLRHALGLLHIVLGANMSSRLFNEVREKKGLAYEIGTVVKYFQDTGAFIVHAGVNNRKVRDAVKVILKELKRIKDKPVTVSEFRRAKEFYLGQLMLALEDTLDHMFWIGESTAALDKVYSLEDIIAEVKKIKRQDIQKVARYIFDEKKINLALIGPLKDNEQAIYDELRLS